MLVHRRRSRTSRLPVRLPEPRGGSILASLHEQLRAAIVDGRLQPGLRLPSTRALAKTCGISRNTAVAAYDLLLSEGYVVTQSRAGAFVAQSLPRLRPRRALRVEPAFDRRLAAFWRTPPEMMPADVTTSARFDFRLGVGDKARFPFDVWRRLAARSLRAFAREPALYAGARGRGALREAIAKHVSFTRSVACRPDDIVVTSASQQAIDLLARVLVTPSRTVVAVEDPCYPPWRAALAAAGARIVPVAVDNEGIVVDALPADANIVCVTPSHQFPLGVAMSMRRRAALLEFANARNAVVIEDDYDGEFRFGGRPLDALQSIDRGESVFYVGTFSKSLFPGIRIGFVVAPPWAQDALKAAKQCADWHCPVLDQDTLAAFIAEGHMARHVRRMHAVYRARRERLLAILARDFGRWLDPVPTAAGLHVAAFAKRGVDVAALVAAARAHDVGLHALRPYYSTRRARDGLVLGYGAIGEDDIVEGLARVRRCLAA